MSTHNCQEYSIVHGSELVCGKCGTVLSGVPADFYNELVEDMERAATAKHSMPVNSLKRVKHGSQHDRVSENNKGLGYELGDYRARDFQGKRVKQPTLKYGEVTGQVAGKGMRATMVAGYDVKLECGHIKKCVKEDPRLGRMLRCKFCRLKRLVIAVVNQYPMPAAYKNMRDDLFYIFFNTSCNQLAAKLQLDVVAQRYFGDEADRVYQDVMGFKDLWALKALLELKVNYQGLNIPVSSGIIDQYVKELEELRVFATSTIDKLKMLTVNAP